MIKQAVATTLFAAGVLFAGAAMAQTYPPTNVAPAWNYNTAAGYSTGSIGDTYTTALNDLYSHGFHGVHHLWMQNGMVNAAVVSPHGVQRSVTVNPGSGQISMG
jgi:hypothetical protein